MIPAPTHACNDDPICRALMSLAAQHAEAARTLGVEGRVSRHAFYETMLENIRRAEAGA